MTQKPAHCVFVLPRLDHEPERRAVGGRISVSRPSRGSAGYFLLELVIVVMVIGIVLAVGATVVPGMNEARLLARSRQMMSEAGAAVLSFSMSNHRLPCPADPALMLGDVGFGIEDCSLTSGLVPHDTLLLTEPIVDASQRAIVYTVYRNAGIQADLAAVTNLEDGLDEPVPVINAKDFCQAVRNGDSLAGNGFASISTLITSGGCTATTFVNQAFVLTSAGIADADGDADPFDGDNVDGIPLCFASPKQGRSAFYDDLVFSVSFSTLFGEVCL